MCLIRIRLTTSELASAQRSAGRARFHWIASFRSLNRLVRRSVAWRIHEHERPSGSPSPSFGRSFLHSFRLLRSSRPPALFSIAHALLHGFCQLLLVLGQQRFDLVVRCVADRVDLRAEILA